jgi:divalent metal cation (Fe/Co/Zn/Cd) transporter
MRKNRNRDIEEIGRLFISLGLLCMAGFMIWCSLKSTANPDVAKMMDGFVGTIIGSLTTYWLTPPRQPSSRK